MKKWQKIKNKMENNIKQFICTKENPWNNQPGPVQHPDAVSTGPQLSGWPSGDIQIYRCPNCNKIFEIELEQ